MSAIELHIPSEEGLADDLEASGPTRKDLDDIESGEAPAISSQKRQFWERSLSALGDLPVYKVRQDGRGRNYKSIDEDDSISTVVTYEDALEAAFPCE